MARVPESTASSSSESFKPKLGNREKLLKILCIHGYRQNGEVFKQKTGALRKALKKHAEFVYITAPHEVPPQPTSSVINGEAHTLDQYGWWFSDDDMLFDSRADSDVCVGFQKSWALVEKTFAEQGPFDGVLGFSQGACFTSVLCGMQQREWLDFKFNFAILVAGFVSRCLPHRNHYCEEITIPTLHVIGEGDQIITKEMSNELTACFKDPVVLYHPGGHFVPAADPQKEVYIKFLEERLKEKEVEHTS